MEVLGRNEHAKTIRSAATVHWISATYVSAVQGPFSEEKLPQIRLGRRADTVPSYFAQKGLSDLASPRWEERIAPHRVVPLQDTVPGALTAAPSELVLVVQLM